MNVQIETYGCAMNQSDSEVMSGLLEKHGHRVVEKDGEVLVVNTCTVKTPTENKIKKRLRELQRQGRRVVVAGCIPAADRKIVDEFSKFSFIGVNVEDVLPAVEAAANCRRFLMIKAPGEKVCMARNRLNPFVEITPIAEGCLGSCSYCITRAARGRLRSFSSERIVEQVKTAVAEGVREVWITAQDTGAYGLDSGTNLPELLGNIAEISGDFKVRVGMMNPNNALKFADDLLDVFKEDKIYRFLHLPVQSGSDRILKSMGRKYTVEDFKSIVWKFREKLNTTISTDVIVGYPTETVDEFQETLTLIEEVKPDVLNISRFWPRPGTKAAEMKQHPGWLTKQRSRVINGLFRKVGLIQNKRWKNWSGKTIISEKNEDGSYTARNQWYKPIVIKSRDNIFGKTIDVVVKEATYYDLRGKVI